MICYTLSDCVLKNLNTDFKKKEIRTDLLGVFTQARSPHKIVVDRTGKIIDIYSAAIEDNNPAILYWLQTMGDHPESWEPIDIENIEAATSKEEVFVIVCSQTADKLLIVHHHNGWTNGKYYHKRNILHNSTPIRVLDRNEAISLLSLSEKDAMTQISDYEKDLQKPMITIDNSIKNSIVAKTNSNINQAKIELK